MVLTAQVFPIIYAIGNVEMWVRWKTVVTVFEIRRLQLRHCSAQFKKCTSSVDFDELISFMRSILNIELFANNVGPYFDTILKMLNKETRISKVWSRSCDFVI